MGHALLRNITSKNPCMVRGEGIYLYDTEGKRYIDGASGSALVCNIGHGVKEVAAVLTPQAAELAYNPFHCSHSRAYEEDGRADDPPGAAGIRQVFSVSSGSEPLKRGQVRPPVSGRPRSAVETPRDQPLAVLPRQHLGALACSGYTAGAASTRDPQDAVHIPPAFCYRCHFEKTFPACELKCARALETAILQEGPENVSAFIAEPVVGRPWAAPPRRRAISRRSGISATHTTCSSSPTR